MRLKQAAIHQLRDVLGWVWPELYRLYLRHELPHQFDLCRVVVHEHDAVQTNIQLRGDRPQALADFGSQFA